MAETKLIFNEETLDQESGIYKLYIRLYEGMRTANECTPPDYTTNPPLTEDGEIDIAAMNEGLSAYSTILMKNSAYLYASSIIGVVGEGGGGSGGAGERGLRYRRWHRRHSTEPMRLHRRSSCRRFRP